MPKKTIPAIVRGYSALITAATVIGFPLLSMHRRLYEQLDCKERRTGPNRLEYFTGPTVWLHAASLGETRLLLQFVKILKQKHPQDYYVCTSTTKTGVAFLRSQKDPAIISTGFLPVDTLGAMNRMLHRFSVNRVWIMETELWPSMLFACRSMGIPVGIVNGRIEELSGRRYHAARFIFRPLFEELDPVLAQSDLYADRFKELGVDARRLHVVGNLKRRIVLEPLSATIRSSLRKAMSIAETDIVITAGCLHAGEGETIRKARDLIAATGVSLRWLVVPRYRAEVSDLVRELGPDTVTLDGLCSTATWSICIVDKMGILENAYGLADMALVGGTFCPVGGHSMWDATRFCIPVLFGPDVHEQEDSARELIEANVGFGVSSADDLAQKVLSLIGNEKNRVFHAIAHFSKQINSNRLDLAILIP